MARTLLISVSLCLLSQKSEGADGVFRMRARESYDWLEADLAGNKWRYQSFAHSINIWYEIPFNWAFGLATGSYATPYRQKNSSTGARPNGLGDEVKFLSHGLELKKWWHSWFVRSGIYWQIFQPNSRLDVAKGVGGLVSCGYEFNISGVGLALESGMRKARFANLDLDVNVNMLVLGVHFYSI